MRDVRVIHDLLAQFLDLCIVERKPEQCAALVTDDVHCIGLRGRGVVCGREALTGLLRREASRPASYRYEIENCEVSELSREISAVYAELSIWQEFPGGTPAVVAQLSAQVTWQGEELRFCSLHFSFHEQLPPEITPSERVDRIAAQTFHSEIQEESFQALNDSIPGGMMGGYLEPGFPLYFINEHMLAYLGYTYDEFLRDTQGYVLNCMHPDDREAVDETVKEQLRGSDEYIAQYRMRKNGGDYIWVSDHGKLIATSAGRQAIISVCLDITDLVLLQRKLEEKNAALEQINCELKGLADTIPGGICEVAMDEYFTLLYGNEAFYRLYGYTPEEMGSVLQNRLVRAIHEADIPMIRQTVDCARREGRRSFEFEKRIYRKNGEMAWVLTRGIFCEKNDRAAMNCVVIDITGRKLAEQELKISEERFRIALSKTSNVIFEYDIARHAITHCNQEIGRIDNAPESLVENGTIHRDYVRPFLEMYAQIISGAQSASCTVRARRPGGTFGWQRVTLNSILDDTGVPVRAIGISEDVTKERETELAYAKGEQYRAAMLADAVIYYEIDLTQNRIETDHSFKNRHSGITGYGLLLETVASVDVHPEDRKAYLNLFNRENVLRQFEMGKCEFTMEHRRMTPKGSYVWMQSTMHLLRDSLTGDIKGFIYVKDIDKQKQDKISLEYRSQRDSLTGLFNKGTTEAKIKKILAESTSTERHAFLIIDVDHFKRVNDTYGHLYGDHILSDAAKGIACLFRSSDIVGRIGGDEFVVFIRDIGRIELVEQRAEQICGLFVGALPRGESSCEVSCSVGISLYQKHGRTFEELYQNADIALYEAKKRGRNRFVLYRHEMQSAQWQPRSNTEIESDHPERTVE